MKTYKEGSVIDYHRYLNHQFAKHIKLLSTQTKTESAIEKSLSLIKEQQDLVKIMADDLTADIVVQKLQGDK